MATKTTKFQKGKSGNPAGKKPGTRDKRTELRELLKPRAPELLQVVLEQALAGDLTAARLILDRILPPVRATSEPVNLILPAGSLSDQAQSIMQAATDGRLTTDEAAGLMAVLQGQLRIKEQDELERRLTALEQAQGGKS